MTLNEIAEQLIVAGWALVRLAKGSKGPTQRWKTQVCEAKHFKDDDNIGFKCGEPSGWRVDVDCDVPEAIAAARLLLPRTGVIFGRSSKPESHYVFTCPDIDSRQFTDVTDANHKSAMIIELRSTGGYTMMPPSIHPSGESVRYDREQTPMTIAEADLEMSVVDVAIVAFVLRHWSDLHHHDMGSFAGLLLQSAVQPARVRRICKTISQLALDHQQDILNYANRTIDKYEHGDTDITGAPHLKVNLGEAAVAKLRGWLKQADTTALGEMNQRHFFTTLGTSSVIGREDKLDGVEGQVLFQRPKELTSEYANRIVMAGTDKHGDPVHKPLFDLWLKWPNRRQFRQVVFQPPPVPADPADYNLWRGYGIEPVPPTSITMVEACGFAHGNYVPGRCFRILHHIRHVIANDDPAYHHVLLNWLAAMVQRPGEVAGTAHIWISEEGAGKNVAVSFISRLFHPSMVFSGASDLVVGKFNACARNRIFFNVNESDGKKLRRNFDRVKMIITESRTYVEPKGVDAYAIDNFAHVLFTTNPDQDGNVDLPAQVGQRRLVFQQVNNRYANDRCSDAERKAYFDPLYAELQDKRSLGAFLHFLMTRDLWDYDPYAKLVTAEERRQRRLGLTGPMRWLWDIVAAGRMPTASTLDGSTTKEMAATAIYEMSYKPWAKDHNETLIGIGPWGKVVNRYLWVIGTHHTRDGNVGILVTIEELEQRLRTTSDPTPEMIELIWSKGHTTQIQADSDEGCDLVNAVKAE